MSCSPVNFNTQVFVEASGQTITSCEGVLVIAVDPLTDPSGVSNVAVNVLVNCKGDVKLTLLDDNGCKIDSMVLKCSQFDVVDIANIPALAENDAIPAGFTHVIQINGRNLTIMSEYVELESKAYFYRGVKQAYANLWCGLEHTCDPDLLTEITSTDDNYALSQALLKARIVALKQLCECGKVCNDNFPKHRTNTCQALKGCCPPY
jgi:hypothetical protein